MVTSLLFQPKPLGSAPRLAVVVGAELSMLMPETVALALLPAISVAVPMTDWPAPSSISVTVWVELATPEVASLAVKLTVTGPLYQPSALAAVVGAPLIVGG